MVQPPYGARRVGLCSCLCCGATWPKKRYKLWVPLINTRLGAAWDGAKRRLSPM